MHIAIDARELTGQATGVGRYLQRLLQEWTTIPAAHRHRFTLFTPQRGLAAPAGLESTVVVVPGAGGTRWEQGALAAAVRRAGPDLFFAPGYSAPLLMGCPSVVAIHDVSFAAHPEWFRWREGLRRRLLARMAGSRARVVLTISAFSRDEIVRHLGIPAARILVIPLGTEAAPVASERREPLVLFVGSIFSRRHVPVLLEAFGRLARERGDVRLEVVGDNRTWPHQDLQALAEATGAGGRIRLRAWVDEAELSSLYARASAFAFLSSYEGFGLTPLEALAAGVPPIVLDTAVAREVYGEAALRVRAPDPALVHQALHDALDGPGRQRVLAAAPAVLARFRWDRTAAQTLMALVEAAG